MSRSKQASQIATLLGLPYQKAHQLLTGLSILDGLSSEQTQALEDHVSPQKTSSHQGQPETLHKGVARNLLKIKDLRDPFLDRGNKPAEFPYEGHVWSLEQQEAFFGIIWSYLDGQAWKQFRKHLQENHPEELPSAENVLRKIGASITMEDGTLKAINEFNHLIRNFKGKDKGYINNRLMNLEFVFGIQVSEY